MPGDCALLQGGSGLEVCHPDERGNFCSSFVLLWLRFETAAVSVSLRLIFFRQCGHHQERALQVQDDGL